MDVLVIRLATFWKVSVPEKMRPRSPKKKQKAAAGGEAGIGNGRRYV
jgi:hypothetical protein